MTRDPGPTFITIHDPLDTVRLALIGLGARAQSLRSVALDFADQLLLLAYDPDSDCTLVAVGGAQASSTASWLSHQLGDAGCHVDLPPVAPVA